MIRDLFTLFLCLISGLLLFILPFNFASSPAISMSYQIGYSNLHFLILLLFFFIFWYLFFCYFKINIFNKKNNKIELENKIFKIFFIIIFCSSIIFHILFSLLIVDDIYFWGESSYLFRRIKAINIGMHPYIDFEYLYGPLLLYLPIFLKNYLNLNLNISYVIVFNLFYIVSFFLLFRVISNYLNLKNKYLIFILLVLGSYHYSFSLGIPQLYIRSILTIYFLLFLNKVLENNKNNNYLFILLPFIFFILWSLFPEQSLVFIISSLTLFLFNKNKLSFVFNYLLIISFLIFIIFNNNFLFSSFKSIILFTSGARNFPVLLNFFTFTYLFFLIVNLIFLSKNFNIKTIFKNKFYLNNHQSYLIVFVLGFINSPLSFGRADPGHILIGSIGIFLSTLYIINYFDKKWMSNLIYYLISVFFVLIIFSYLNLNYRAIANIGLVNLEEKFLKSNIVIKNNQYLSNIIAKHKNRKESNLTHLNKLRKMKNNFKNIKFIPPYYDLYENNEYNHSYLLDFKMLFSSRFYGDLIYELNDYDYIYVGKSFFCSDPLYYEQSLYNKLSITHYRFESQNSFNKITDNLCNYLSENFKSIKYDNIDILVKK